MTTLKSFHGDKKIKTKYINRLKAHAKADEIIKGRYWKDGKGCAVGCTIHGSEHNRYETELGLPEWLARLEDVLFEGLPNSEAKEFPCAFLKAIPVGVSLDTVKHKFCAVLMRENIQRVHKLKMDEAVKATVVTAASDVLRLHEQAGGGGLVTDAEWSAAWSAAWSAELAAESAAWSAAESAELAAELAARSAARSAELAARSAARSAESAAYSRYAAELLRLLKEAR